MIRITVNSQKTLWSPLKPWFELKAIKCLRNKWQIDVQSSFVTWTSKTALSKLFAPSVDDWSCLFETKFVTYLFVFPVETAWGGPPCQDLHKILGEYGGTREIATCPLYHHWKKKHKCMNLCENIILFYSVPNFYQLTVLCLIHTYKNNNNIEQFNVLVFNSYKFIVPNTPSVTKLKSLSRRKGIKIFGKI